MFVLSMNAVLPTIFKISSSWLRFETASTRDDKKVDGAIFWSRTVGCEGVCPWLVDMIVETC